MLGGIRDGAAFVMSSMPSFFTQANNFGSAVDGGVDPRTGLFNVQIALGSLVGNRNLGPALPLRMGYSPLNRADEGFGQGISLGLTTYDTDGNLLALSSGEQYKVHEAGAAVVLRQDRLDTVHVAKDQDFYRIVRKSGDVEILTGPRNAFSLKVPTALLTPAGHRLALTWDFTGQRPRLREIRDESDTLLAVEYAGDAKATLSVLPGQPEGYKVEFWFRNGLLGSVHHFGLGPDAPLEWDFTYTELGRRGEWGSWISGVTMPGGMTETAYYRNDGQGHQFPASAGLPALPYVYRTVQEAGGGQPAIEATYSYTDNNFLGGHSGVTWDPNRDNLYEVLTDYSYGSTESRTCAGQTMGITRTYNQYHLQTAEASRQNGHVRLDQTDYYAVPGRAFDQQPPQFQLPRQRTVTWTDPQGASRSEVTLTSFDAAGNPQGQTDPDGTQMEWTYYPATGSGTDCPPDPNGFTRLLASVTRTPPRTAFAAPAYRTAYRYTAYVGTPDPRVSTVVLKSQELRYGDNQLLTREALSYATAGAEFGRLTRMVTTEYPGGATGPSYDEAYAFSFAVDGDALIQGRTLTTHDQLTTTVSQTHSRFTGHLRSVTDVQGNTEAMTYDGLGRLLTQTANPGTPHQARESRSYALGGTAPFTEVTTDELGNQFRESLDGAGRPVLRERKDTDGDGAWYTAQALSYDEQGRVASISAVDHVRGGGQVELVQAFSYDDWSQLAATTYSDGAAVLTRTDPVRQTTTVQHLGGGVPVTGTEVTTVDTRGDLVRVARFDRHGAPAGQQVMERDGWGRLRRETDELGNVTQYDYDLRGRLAETTLPDGTKVAQAYAPFTTEALVTGLTVDDVRYGEQSFDGLGRLTVSRSGGRSLAYRYAAPGDPVPSSVTEPDQQVRAYQYIPQLDNALAQVQAGSLTQQFKHDPVSGALTAAREGSVTIARDYYPSGLPRTDTTSIGGLPDGTARSSYTVNGLDQTYTGVDGTTMRVARDPYGRVSAVTDPAMQASLSYDAGGRVVGWVAQDPQSGYSLTTALTLDDFGREVRRAITDNHGAAWTLTQDWQRNNQLSRRTLWRGSTRLREETFSYGSRDQLTGYACDGASPPLDIHGNAVTRQWFTYDRYGNVTGCQTDFRSGSDTAAYLFENPADPCQLTGIRHTHPDYPARVDLRYDAAGRLIADDAGHTLSYDLLGRLQSVTPASQYRYDPLDRLLTQEAGGATSVLYYREESLASVTAGDQQTRLLRLDSAYVAQRRERPGAQTLLLGTDGKGTVLTAGTGQQTEEYAYTAYGSRPVGATSSVPGYDGERADPALGWSHLGNGARAYAPELMRFTTPDTLSPFGAGGINPYAYCLGDPVNRIDPSGHLSWMAWLGIGLGIAGLLLTVVTGGLAIVAAGGLVAALSAASTATLVVGALGVVSDVTAIASGALEETSPTASSVLGWVSLGTGLAGLAHAAVGLARGASRLARRAPELAEDARQAAGSAWRARTPTIRLISNAHRYAREQHFKFVRNIRSRRVWLSKYLVSADHIGPLIERALDRGRNVTVLSGQHGTRLGRIGTRGAQIPPPG